MSKLSRPNYGLEQQIMQMVFRLRDKKSSQIFKQPVQRSLVPDYYEKIKQPMDLSTMLNKLKQGRYIKAKQIYADLQLIISNCKHIIKRAEQFHECIKTEWNNFQKQLKKKQISIHENIEISDQAQKRLLAIEQKRKKKKIPMLQTVLDNQKKNILPQYSILPPLPSYLFEDKYQIKEQLPQDLSYKKQIFTTLSQQQKTQKLNLIINHQLVEKQFEKVCVKKLTKYKKILEKKILWIQKNIIQKCLQKKKFKKMLLPQYLSKLACCGQLYTQLNIRKIQMYVKQVTYWVQQYSQILSHYMKQKFVDTCRAIRKCLLRILRYKRIPKTTKISLQFNEQQNQTILETDRIDRLNQRNSMGDQQAKRYQSRMKQFRRMLYKDRSESTKRDTKITIKNQNGDFSIVDWNSQVNQKRKINRGVFGEGIKSLESRQYDEEKRKKQQRKDQLKKDQDFIAERRLIFNKYALEQSSTVFQINWDLITSRKFEQKNEDIETNFEGISLKLKTQQKNNQLVKVRN